MNTLDSRRQTFRIGVVLTGTTAMTLSMALGTPLGEVPAMWWLLLGLFAATGIGLLANLRLARWVAALGMLAGAVVTPVSLIQNVARYAGATSASNIANAAATSLLLVWLCVRAIQALLDRTPRASFVTARIAGGVLAVIAASHLWVVAQVGFALDGPLSIRISAEGTTLFGFWGWQLWHVVALGAGLVLVAGPRTVLPRATTVVLALFAILVPLAIVASLHSGMFGFEIIMLGIVAFPVYLAWWLRDETYRTWRSPELATTV